MPEASVVQKDMIIPKVVHYIWVGGKPLTPLAEHCIASWKQHLPDYTFQLWNEDNSPMDHSYVKEMYAQKKWAFVSDYIRFWALAHTGGIYLDTDMELFQSLDQTLRHEGFVGESKGGQIESSIIGAVQNADFILEALKFYDTTTEFSIKHTSPLVVADAIARSTSTVFVYPSSAFFACAEGEYCPAEKLTTSIGRHHWAESWVPQAGVRKFLRRIGVWAVLKKIHQRVRR